MSKLLFSFYRREPADWHRHWSDITGPEWTGQRSVTGVMGAVVIGSMSIGHVYIFLYIKYFVNLCQYMFKSSLGIR